MEAFYDGISELSGISNIDILVRKITLDNNISYFVASTEDRPPVSSANVRFVTPQGSGISIVRMYSRFKEDGRVPFSRPHKGEGVFKCYAEFRNHRTFTYDILVRDAYMECYAFGDTEVPSNPGCENDLAKFRAQASTHPPPIIRGGR